MINKLKKLFTTSNVFINASFIYILANGIGQGTTLLANVFFTRYMSKYDYGMYSNYYSYVAILVPFVGLNLYFGLANAYIDFKQEIHLFRSSVLVLSLIGMAVTTGVLFLFKYTIGLSISEVAIALAVAHAYGFFLVNYYMQSMNMENDFLKKGLMLAVPNVLQAVFAAVALLIFNSYVSRAIGSSVAILMSGLVAATVIIRKSPITVNTKYWKYVLRISLPAIIGSVSAMIMQQCDKVMITSLKDAEVTAVYALVFNVGYILLAVSQATSGVWQVWIYNVLDQKKYDTIPMVQKWYSFFMLFIATGLYMIAPEIVKILSPESYWHFEYVVPFVIGSYLMVLYGMNTSVIEYNKKTGVTSGIVALAAVVNIVLNRILIPYYSGLGAACTSVVSYIVILVAGGLYLKAKRQFYFSITTFAVMLFTVSLLGLIFYYLMNLTLIRYGVFIIILAVEGLYAYVKRSEVIRILGKK